MAERTNTSKVIHVIGAILRAGREGDDKVRKSIKGWIAFLTGGGFAVYVGIILLNLIVGQVREGWKLEAEQRAAQISALRAIAVEIRDTRSNLDSLDGRMMAAHAQNTAEHAILLDRVRRRQ